MYRETSLFLTINNNTLRVVITSKPNLGGIMYTRDFDPNDLQYGWDSYCMYEDSFTKEEFEEIIELYKAGQKQKASNRIKKRLRDPQIQAKKGGPAGSRQLSELVKDEWFDGCKTLLDLLAYKKMIGIFEQDIEEFGIDYL